MQKTDLHYFPVLIGSLLLASGCASLGDYHYECTQKLRARTEYREAGHPECSKYPRDYKKGWIDGFYEVSTGGSLCPPAIAPECYWKPGQILNDCDNRRHEYYSGWQDGAARASQFPDTHYLKIYETCECPFPRCECGACGPGGGACVSVHGPIADCSCGGAGTCDACNPAGMVYHRGVIESDREIIMMPIPDSSTDNRDPNEDPLPAAVAAPTSTEPPADAQPEPPAISPPEVDVSLGDPNATEEPVEAESIEQPIEPRSAATITAEDVREADEAEIRPPLPPAIPAVEAETPQPVPPQPVPPEKPESPVSLSAPALNTPIARYSFPDDNSQTIEFARPASSLPRVKQVALASINTASINTASIKKASIQKASAKRTAKAKAASSILSDFDIRFDHDGLIE